VTKLFSACSFTALPSSDNAAVDTGAQKCERDPLSLNASVPSD
jgi:hypothetical protein